MELMGARRRAECAVGGCWTGLTVWQVGAHSGGMFAQRQDSPLLIDAGDDVPENHQAKDYHGDVRLGEVAENIFNHVCGLSVIRASK